MAEATDNEIESLKSELGGIKAEVSGLRKRGFDTKIIELKLMKIPSKIQMADATRETKDVTLARKMMNNIKIDIQEISQKDDFYKDFDENTKKEIEKIKMIESGEIYNKYSRDEIIERTNKLINEALNYLNDQKYYDALHSYLYMRSIYKYLPRDIKKQLYKPIIEVYNILIKSKLFIAIKEEGKISLFDKIKRFLKNQINI